MPNMLVSNQCVTAVDRTPAARWRHASTDGIWNLPDTTTPRWCRRAGPRPRDKPLTLVEEAVGLVEQWIVEPSRPETFRAIMDLNDYISDRIMWLNCRHATPGRDSRRERFEAGKGRCCRIAP